MNHIRAVALARHTSKRVGNGFLRRRDLLSQEREPFAMHDKAWRIGGRLVYLALHHRSAGVNCGSPRTSDDATFPTHASRPPILRGRRSVARGSTSPRPNSARLNRTQQQRESECRQKLLHWGCLAIISSHQACGGRPSSAPSPPCKDGRTLSSLRSISNCKPAACVSGARMMRRIRFDRRQPNSQVVPI